MKNKILSIEQATYLGRHKIKCVFNDGKTVVVDFLPFLKHSQHPEIRKYLSESKFRAFNLEHGDLVWNDFDLVFPIADLYEGNLRHDEPSVKSARKSRHHISTRSSLCHR